MDPKYIAGSLKRESCKVLLKEFNKELLPGSLTEHPIYHLVHFDILHRIHAVLLADIFLGCCGFVAKWERDNLKHMSYMSTVITLNTYLQSLPNHITNAEVIFIHICVYIHTYMCVHDFETDDCGTV